MKNFRFFKPSEFEKASPPCLIEDMDEDFLQRLDDARSLCSYKFVIKSAYRTREYEIEKGRKGTSSHTKGCAVDISCPTPQMRLHILICLIAVGFRRFGIYDTFIHVDSDTSKPACIWLKS